MSRLGKGYVICDIYTDEIIAVAKVAGEALYTAMQLEQELNSIPNIYSIEDYNRQHASSTTSISSPNSLRLSCP